MRWIVCGREKGKSFSTEELAGDYRKALLKAANLGEEFSLITGEPVSWARKGETVLAHTRAWIKTKWDDADVSPNSRKSAVEGIIPVILATLRPLRNRPADKLLRKALRHYALRPPSWNGPVPAPEADALAWLDRASRPLVDLGHSDVLRPLLDDLGRGVKRQQLKPSSVRTRRTALSGCLAYAVEREIFTTNPVQGLRIKRQRTAHRVNPRHVPNTPQALRLLDAVTAQATRQALHLRAFFDCLYWAGMRPAEIRHLRRIDCQLPTTGWGRLTLAGSTPEVSADWTDGEDRFEDRELKHRSEDDVRIVPIPPILVTSLTAHLTTYGTAPDGRLFWDVRTDDHQHIPVSLYGPIWTKARDTVLTDDEKALNLASRPYDLRHGNASMLLDAGVPAPEVARRLGHSVAMLNTTYAHWLHGQEQLGNTLIDAALQRLASTDATIHTLTRTNTPHGPITDQIPLFQAA
ncbi:tyrosine-type recombinase/integrase [Actinocorallia sp. API 0066]|uniref:tyrosine-type recombinase/integrase n=1 Tax=Actinocorallia sp. API 0066 TaxID=2896846 RepID=UPI001E3A6EBF|nr:tyrosine-type recombinase/integrase [Actinocorallia sp. API 0066]MCD0450612.1 tyrosine-type recombinase/integrase [Actinocorallia sp. API 0066]